MRVRSFLLSLLLGGLLVLLYTGCEEDVVAVLGEDRAFSMYGVLNPLADTQKVLVYPIENTLNAAPEFPLPATVTSTDLTTGAVRTWIDSLDPGPSGDEPAHLFWSPFRVEYGHRYRIEVTSTETDARSSAELLVPPKSAFVPGEPLTLTRVVQPVRVPGGVPRLMRLEAEFWVLYAIGFTATGGPILEQRRHTIPYGDHQRRQGEDWIVSVDLSDAYITLRDLVRADTRYQSSWGVGLGSITLRGIAANEAWNPPEGIFDADVLVQPGTLSNVENGFGFIGAGYRMEKEWVPVDSIVARSGFRAL